MKLIKFLILGICFGIILTKSEALSWYRIHEMFHFQSFHMYGLLGSAIATGMLSVFLIKKFKIKTISGQDINITPKEFKWKSNLFGGIIFGLGWGLTGACPGPIYAIIGTGLTPFIVVLFAAIIGTYVYGALKKKLPH
jgi:uncharacterized membrane protein YedE/YeeE